MSADAQKAKEVFLAIVGQVPPEQWQERLDEACGESESLRCRVSDLLRAHAESGGFLQQPALAVDETAAYEPIAEKPGVMIGKYKLLQTIGEGGMGVVYMAEQTQPVERRVALKIIKPGMDTKQVIARFEAERQALAMMDHPNIAKVLDAGTTESGRPYFVMELVKGIPITKYCDEQHLTPRERLELFIAVCQAVQHAHQKGIIHRDVKPSNVMVALYDGKPVPKVIDFGVAKATSQKLTERTLFTQFGQIVGTLEYMSPEQAELNQLDVDTRSDIYSLGVLLYELLTGSTPLERERLRNAGFAEMQRIICEEEPPKPSARLSTSGDRLPTIAKQRSILPQRLHQLVRGDLDWIVMKALEKDRARRYETATALAHDLRRCLDDEPVEARPPSRMYQLRKLARRNKVPVAAAVVVALTLVVTTVINIAMYFQVAGVRQRLQDAFIYQAIIEAMAADEEAMEAAVSEAIGVGASPTWRSMLQGLLADHGGNPDKAVSLLEEVCEQEPQNVAARAMLATAYLDAGRADDCQREITMLQRMDTTDDVDLFFRSSVESVFWNTRSAIADLERLVAARRSWELARVMLARAKVYSAWDTGDWHEAAEAVEIINSTRARLPDLLSVHSVALYANLAAHQLAPDDISAGNDWLENADTAAKVLEQRFPHSAFQELAAYYYTRHNDVDRAIAALDEAWNVGKRSTADSLRSAMLFEKRRYGEREESSILVPFAALEICDDRREVARICHAFLEKHPGVTVRSVWPRVVLCACGEREKAAMRKAWEEMLDDDDTILWNLKYSMNLLTDRWTLQRALDEAGGSRIRQSLVHFAIAEKYLYLDGDPRSAEKHFQQCVNYQFIDVDYYYWAQAYLAHLKDPNRPNWPHWLPNQQRE